MRRSVCSLQCSAPLWVVTKLPLLYYMTLTSCVALRSTTELSQLQTFTDCAFFFLVLDLLPKPKFSSCFDLLPKPKKLPFHCDFTNHGIFTNHYHYELMNRPKTNCTASPSDSSKSNSHRKMKCSSCSTVAAWFWIDFCIKSETSNQRSENYRLQILQKKREWFELLDERVMRFTDTQFKSMS